MEAGGDENGDPVAPGTTMYTNSALQVLILDICKNSSIIIFVRTSLINLF